MSFRYISTRIELSFWQFVVTVLSESKTIRQIVCWTYQYFLPRIEVISKRIERKRALRWAAAGLGLGLFTGILISVCELWL